jgi:hypothetical protein
VEYAKFLIKPSLSRAREVTDSQVPRNDHVLSCEASRPVGVAFY